ncbi:MAG: flavodoxin [Cellvibrionales bacterium TMED49]|mgnify:CR=1 FL=1|nr:MAG: flavodoxin [Cellvibrionales bacterium TMED49]
MKSPKKLLIISHSQSGKTDAMTREIINGCKQQNSVEIISLPAQFAGLEDLLSCDGLIFGTPENFGTMSGMLKDFFDRTYYPAQPYKLNLPYGLFISAANDGTGAVRDINRILKGYPLRQVANPVICKGILDDRGLTSCRDLGLSLAMGLDMGIF